MINKVAISQCVRDAFPKDYEGVYSEDEMVASGAIPVDYKELDDQKPEEQPTEEEDPAISQEQRQQLFKAAQANFGKDKGNAVVKSIIEEMGLTSTTGMKMSTYNKVSSGWSRSARPTRRSWKLRKAPKMTVQPKNKATGGKGR